MMAWSSCSEEEEEEQQQETALEVGARRQRIVYRLKCLYFFQAVGPSSWGRYSSVFYDGVGLTPAQVGYITGAMPFTRAMCMPLWGLVADRTSKKKVALVTQACGVGVLSLLALPGVAARDGRADFLSILAVSVSSAAFASAGVLDSYALDTLASEKSRFGEIRLWSAVSWGISNFVMGYVADVTGGFLVNILFFVASTALSVTILAILIPEQRARTKHAPPDSATTTKKVTRRRHFVVALFFAELVVFGAAMGLVERLLFVYIVEALDGSYALCGATVVFTVLLEIPIFAKADFLLAKLGHDTMFCLALAAYVPRVIGYTLLTKRTRILILPIELCHGVTFGLMFSSAVDLSAKLAPPGQEATYQTIQNSLRACFGAGLGAALGGFFWTRTCRDLGRRPNCKRGAVQVFRFAGAAVFAVLVIHLLSVMFSTCRCASSARKNTRVVGRDVEDDAQIRHNPLADPLLFSTNDAEHVDDALLREKNLSSSSSSSSSGED